MTAHHVKRNRLMGFMIKQQSWDLETLRERDRMARNQLMQADKELKGIETAVEQTEKSIRRVMEGESSLDLAAIQSARQFLADQQNRHKGKLLEHQRASQRVHQTKTQMKEATLYIKALKQVKAKSERAITLAQEKLADDQASELWIQRYGRD